MISHLIISDYKSIGIAEFEMRKLTLFSGTNSSGKSSAIQALLLAVDNISTSEGERNLRTTYLPVMSFNESRNYITNAKEYGVKIFCGDENADMQFLPKDEQFIATTVRQTGTLPEEVFNQQKNIFHLSAIRSGDLGSPKMNPNPDSNPLGNKGEFIIDYYHGHMKEILQPSLVAYNEIKTLEGQVNYWLQRLTGYTLTVSSLGSEYLVRYISAEGKSLHPYNVGTGVNFVAETLIVCLSSRLGSTVIIENPEIHLHPSAQADMLDFLVAIANAGIQVIIESHSDHFFNGIRRSLKTRKIDREDVSVYNFKKESGLTISEEVELSQEGGIMNYIPGMFEQFDIDLDAILM